MKKKNYIIYFLINGKLVEQFSYAGNIAWAKRLRTLALDPPGYPVYYYNAKHSLWHQAVYDTPGDEYLWRSRHIKGLELSQLYRWLPNELLGQGL